MNWDMVCRPKEEGGLGIGNVESKNISLLSKWLGRFPLESNSLWNKVIESKYGNQQSWWDAIAGFNASSLSPWKAISKVSPLFLPLVSLKVEVGDEISFWVDQWVGHLPFSILFPRLYQLSSVHHAPIDNFLCMVGDSISWNFHFRRDLLDWKLGEMVGFLGVLDSIIYWWARQEGLVGG